MNYKRYYVQFNNLVFDEIGMVQEDQATTRFKGFSSEYTFRNGSYSPNKTKHKLVSAGNVSLTISLRMKKLPCDVRKYYPRFAKNELSQVGRLWAVQNNQLLWAWAEPYTYSESTDSITDTLDIDVNFFLPEGVWHKADKLKTFLVPYDPCLFMDCYDFKDIDPCKTGNGNCCVGCASDPVGVCDCCDGCDNFTEDDALCYHKDLSALTDCDPNGFKIIYSCTAAQKYFTDPLGAVHLGQRFCTTDEGPIAGLFYSDTDIPTRNIKITIVGKVHNPYIEINGNGNIIRGDYEDTLEITSDGAVYNQLEDCGRCDRLPVSVWEIPGGMTYGWEIHQGDNKIIIDPGMCCGTVCAWIEADELTY